MAKNRHPRRPATAMPASKAPPKPAGIPVNGIQMAILELASSYGWAALKAPSGAQVGGSQQEWEAWVLDSRRLQLELLGVLAALATLAGRALAEAQRPKLWTPGIG